MVGGGGRGWRGWGDEEQEVSVLVCSRVRWCTYICFPFIYGFKGVKLRSQVSQPASNQSPWEVALAISNASRFRRMSPDTRPWRSLSNVEGALLGSLTGHRSDFAGYLNLLFIYLFDLACGKDFSLLKDLETGPVFLRGVGVGVYVFCYFIYRIFKNLYLKSWMT